MRGIQHLIDMRKQGYVPVLVFVDTDEVGRMDDLLNRIDPDSANVWIEPTDRLTRLDLRPFIGLQCSVTGNNRERVADVTAGLIKAGAKRVMSAVLQKVDGGYQVVCLEESYGTTH